MSKYYTPKIEEFHVGFEYEYQKHTDKWINSTIDRGCLDDGFDTYCKFRVKYLDKDDIESLGFIAKYKDREKENMYYMDPAISLWFVEHMSLIRLVAPNGRNFTGIIKNKSELKKLLIQLSILEDGEEE